MWIPSPTRTVNHNLQDSAHQGEDNSGTSPRAAELEIGDITYLLPWQEKDSAWGNKLNILPTNIYLITDTDTGKQKDED